MSFSINLLKKSRIRYPRNETPEDWAAFVDGMTRKTESGCWVWLGCRNSQGYGALKRNGTHWGAHRLIFKIFVEDPGEKYVLHKCDNPSCVNPEHMYLGTHWDNMQDRNRRKRVPRLYGGLNGQSKLTEPDAYRIMALSDILSHAEIGRAFGVSTDAVQSVACGKTWTSVFADFYHDDTVSDGGGI